MYRAWGSFLLSLALLSGGAVTGIVRCAQGLPALDAVRAERPPVIDGDLGDDVWQRAGKATGFLGKRSQGLVKVQTGVRLLFDDRNLYVGFRCNEPNPAGIEPGDKAGENERNVWRSDVIAVFIQPEQDKETYYQFALSAGGMTFDQKSCPEGLFYEAYSPDWETSTSIGADSWTAEMRIPLAEIGVGPQMGRTWRMNFCRSRRQTREASSWSHVFSWHNAEKFGIVRGITVGAEAVGLSLEQVCLGDKRAGENVFRAKLANVTGSDLAVSGRLLVTSPSGASQAFAVTPIAVAANAAADLEVPYGVSAAEGEHRIMLELSDKGGKARYRSPPGIVDLKGLLDCYVERSYYTREKTARVVCLVNPAVGEAILQGAELRCAIADTGILAEFNPPARARMALDLPLSAVAPAEYRVDVALSGPRGRPIASQQLKLLKLQPGKGSEVKVVRRDKGAYLLVDGKPFFYLANLFSHRTLYGVDVMKEMADAGFTAFCWWRGSANLEGTLSVLDAGKKYGLMITPLVHKMYGFKQLCPDFKLLLDRPAQGSDDEPPEVKRVRAKVKEVQDRLAILKDHEALLYWCGVDEPGIGRMPQVALLSQFIREIDLYHPIKLLTAPPATALRYKHRSEVADIYNTHTYLHGNRPMITPYDRARRGRVFSDMDRKVYVGTLTANTSWSYRGLTYAEQRCEAYLGLIGGWRGLMWFNGRHQFLECWENLKKVVGEIRQLAPVLLAEDVEQTVTVAQPQDRPLYHALFEHEGHRYILAANSRATQVKGTFTVPGLKNRSRVKVWFERRKLRSTGESFSDTFAEFGVHVYEF